MNQNRIKKSTRPEPEKVKITGCCAIRPEPGTADAKKANTRTPLEQSELQP